MSDGAFALAGFADPVGTGLGFLTPLFAAPAANSVCVQKIDGAGLIESFEASALERVGVDPPVLAAAAGEPSVQAFAFGLDDVLVERGELFASLLADRLRGGSLADRPMLALEVAEFLGREADWPRHAAAAFLRLREASIPGAERWRDLGLLTPEVRRRMKAARPDLASMWTAMTVTTERRTSSVRGLRRHLDAILERQLAGEVTAAAASLAKLYLEPLDPRRVRVEVEGEERSRSGEAIVLIADPAFERLAEELSRSPELNIDAYAMDYTRAYLERLKAHPGPAFAVVGRHGLRRLPDLIRDAPQSVVGIEVLAGSPGAISSPGGDMFGLLDGPVVTLPWSDGGRSRAADARRARGVAHAVAAVVAAHRGDDAPMSSLARRIVFLRARGSGPRPAKTGWGELYDRIWGLGVIPQGALCFSPGHRDGRDLAPEPDSQIRTILFGHSEVVRSSALDRSFNATRTNAAVMVGTRPQSDDEVVMHRRAIGVLLGSLNWRLDCADYPVSADAFRIVGPRYGLDVMVAPPISGQCVFDRLLQLDLRELSALRVTSQPTAASILTHLCLAEQLEVGVRDLVAFTPDQTVWSLIGSLLRRVCAGPGSRSKTQLVALLAAHAFRTGDLDLDNASHLYEAVHDPNIGVHAHLLVRRVRREGDAVISDAFLVAAPGNEHAPQGMELAQPFRLVAHRDGIALLRQDAGEPIDP